jgi:signal transduction histidine kinase
MGHDPARVLVIDDEEVVRDSCARVLRGDGHTVAGAEDGNKGLTLFGEFRPDLVLVDLKMPGKTGMEVLEELQRTDPDVIKIVITGHGSVSSAVDAMKRGAYDFVPKPFSPDEISLTVARGLEKRRLLQESNALRLRQERIRRNMVSLVSHELSAPLSATIQHMEVILAGMAGEVAPGTRELIEICNRRLRDMLDLLRTWINLAVLDPTKMAEHFEKLDLSLIAKESIERLRPLAGGKRVDLRLECPKRLSPVRGGKTPLGEVFNNLISNAIKYNREGGWVKVRIDEQGKDVCIEVSDNGPGIEDVHLSRIFDEFYRVDPRRNAPVKGSGLGLSIVKTLVEAHGGTVDVKSRFGEGTTFLVRLPMFSDS